MNLGTLTHTYIGTIGILVNEVVIGRIVKSKILWIMLCMLGGFGIPQLSAAQVTLSGTVYSDAGTTPQAVSKTISVAVGTSTIGRYSTTTTVTSGAWTITIPLGHGIATGTPILVWIDNDATTRGSVLTKANSSATAFSITGLDLYKDRVIARHEASSATSTTNVDFGFYTSAQDSDVQHSTSSTGVIISAGNELYVWAGKTLAPGGNLTVAGNASTSATDGSIYLAGTAVYTAGGTLTLGGSLTAVSTATFTGNTFTTFFNATTTGKVINAPLSSIGNVTFNGAAGGWTFTSAATTSALTILQGTVVAPSTTLGVTGIFQNDATFTHNGGTLNIVGAGSSALGDIATYVAGRDVSGSATGIGNASTNFFAVSSNNQTIYMAKSGSATLCNPTSGNAIGCELLVFDISSTTNPSFVTGRDSAGSNASTSASSINTMVVSGDYLYVGKTAIPTACNNIAGTAGGCELMVFDISSTTNPIYVAGRDADGTATGTINTAVMSLVISGTTLYMAKTAAGNTDCSLAPSDCELMVFDISSSTNPIYVTGRDASGSATGGTQVQINSLAISGSQLFVVKAAGISACSQTAGSATGCELMVFDIASTTNPTYVAGRDSSGSATGTASSVFNFVVASGSTLYIAKDSDATACSQTAGSAIGCELQIYDISSSTNPLYVRGVDAAGSYSGIQSKTVNQLRLIGSKLYAVTAGISTACAQTVGRAIGCELLIFDVSSSTAVRLLGGKDSGGDASGIQLSAVNAVFNSGNTLYLGKAADVTACSQTAGSAVGCELQVYDITQSGAGIMMGTMGNASALGNVVASGTVEFRDNASTSNFTVAVGTTTAPSQLTLAGNFSNLANFVAGENTLILSSTSAQTLSGNLIARNALYRAQFMGGGTKTFASNASTTIIEIAAGATVVAPNQLTVSDTFTNGGTFTAAGTTLNTFGFGNEFVSAHDSAGGLNATGATSFEVFKKLGSIIYVGKSVSVTACSQTAGLAVGCELVVYDISSTTNPTYVAGRDSSGSATGTASVGGVESLAFSGDNQVLYVGKTGHVSACTPTFGNARSCELMVFDISSTTNPRFITALDSSGNNASTSAISITDLRVSGNYLYVGKNGSIAACNNTAGTAAGCELMVFDISSTTNPIYISGVDSTGSATSTGGSSINNIEISGNSLYAIKGADGTACSQVAGSAVGCELLVFDISSTTNPLFIAGRDTSGSATGTGNLSMQSISIQGSLAYIGKFGSGSSCVNTPGSALGCELIVFDISSSTNPTYVTARDTAGSAGGTSNATINSIIATGSSLYVGKAGNVTTCSQTAGSAVGCELMIFDIASTTNPTYIIGRDSGASFTGVTSVPVLAVLPTTDLLLTGRTGDLSPCESTTDLRFGCELIIYNNRTTLSGTLTGASALASVISNGKTAITSIASTTNLTIATSSEFTAPGTDLSLSGNFTNNGTFVANNGEVILTGTNQTLSSVATTTFYDLTNITTVSATTSFSTTSPYIITRNLTLTGTTSALLKLRSVSNGSAWKIDPQSSTTIIARYLDVLDSNNISATSVTCEVGCLDSGNNTNWGFAGIVGLTISGRLYQNDGLTPVTTGRTIVAAVGTSTPSRFSTTTDGSGNFSFTGIATTTMGTFASSSYTNSAFFYDTIYANGQFVATGALFGTARIMTSANGSTWTNREVAGVTNGNFYGVTYGEGRYVVVGDQRIITSTDGINWENVAGTGNGGRWQETAYGNGRFVAVGDCTGLSGTFTECIAYSNDGITWATTTAAGDNDGWNSVTYGDGKFVAVSANTEINQSVIYSTDGITWTAVTASGDDEEWKDVTYGNGQFVAVAFTGPDKVMTSTNGITWTSRTGPFGTSNVAYGNGLYVAIQDCTNVNNCLMTSANGITWATTTVAATSSYNGLAYGHGRFVSLTHAAQTGWYADAGFGADTPITLFIDGSVDDGTTLTYGVNNRSGVTTINNRDIHINKFRVAHASTTGTISLANADMYDASDDADILFTSTSSLTTVAAGFELAANTTLIAPHVLSLAGDLALNGTFDHNNGTVAFDNTSTVTATGTLTNFYNLTINSIAGTGSSTQSVRFNAPILATSTFAMAASSSAAFLANANATFKNISFVGSTSANRVWLRSTVPGTPWQLYVTGSKLVEYVNARDSDASNVSGGIMANSSIDAGNNTNWNFTAPTVWDSSNWTQYDIVTINYTKVPADLTNFPVFVNLAHLSNQFWSGIRSDGGDIRVTTQDNIEIPREVVFASTTARTGELHFKAPLLSSTTNTIFKIWYNGISANYARTATSGSQNVWTNDYLGVWHISEQANNTAGGYLDSTSYQNHGTGTGMTSSVAGRVGNSQNFNGTNNRITVPRSSVLEPTAAITFSSWLKRNGAQVSFAKPFYYGNDTAPGYGPYGFEANGASDVNYLMTLSSAATNTTNSVLGIQDASWYSVHGTYNGAVFRTYLNGSEHSSTSRSYTIGGYNTIGLGIGDFGDPSGSSAPFKGEVDEVRIASTSRSSAWVVAEYNNQSTTTEFYSTSTPAAVAWNSTNWVLYNSITVDAVVIDEDLTDFPVYVDLSNLSQQFWNVVSIDGSDIRVTTDDGSPVEVSREIVSFNRALQTGELYFKAPAISSSTDTTFRIYFNGTSSVDYVRTATFGSENVWTNNFVAVYHLKEDPSGGSRAIKDSTRFLHHGTGSTTMTSGDSVASKIGLGMDFDGLTTDQLIMSTSSNFANLKTFSVCSWYSHDTYIGAYANLLDKSTDGVSNWNLYLDNANRLGLLNNSQAYKENLYTPSTGWEYLCGTTINSSASTSIKLYNNSVILSGGISGLVGAPADDINIPLRIGAGNNGSYPLDGRMDEIRISSTTRTDAWIKADYYNQATTTIFYRVNAAVIVGSTTLASHSNGQVNNAFTATNKTNESLFAFKLIPNSGTATVTNMIITLSGVTNVIPGDFSNLRLLRDQNNNRQYDVTDVLVGGVGALVISGADGTLTFTGDFLSTTTQNYIVVGDWNAPANGSFVTFALTASTITVIDGNPTHVVTGTVSNIQHSRNNKGGGGGNANVGDPAPAGAGIVSGGGSNGGETIGTDTDFRQPTTNSGSWNGGSNAYDGTDGTYATTSSTTNNSYGNHGFGVPSNNTISGIIVKLEISGTTAAGTVDVELSWNGGTNWTSIKTTPTLTTADSVRTLGSPSDLWGRTWSSTEFTNGNFAVRLTGAPSSNTIQLDAIQVRVYHTTGGGGSGGGGSGGAL